MLRIGPTSSVFDITTYLLMFFVICPAVCGGHWQAVVGTHTEKLFIAVFQAGWFVESMWSQTLVIHMIRTPKIPIIQSRASFPVLAITMLGITILTVIPFTALGAKIGLAPLPGVYFGWLALTIVCYMLLTQWMKNRYVKRYGELL